MKQLIALFALCLVSSIGLQLHAQQVRLTANSTVVVDGRVELKDQKRLQWFVLDGMPTGQGYAYEFGPLVLIAPNGDKVQLKPVDLVNGPVFHYSVSRQLFQQYPQGFELQITKVIRYNPEGTSETLAIPAKDLTVKVLPQPAN